MISPRTHTEWHTAATYAITGIALAGGVENVLWDSGLGPVCLEKIQYAFLVGFLKFRGDLDSNSGGDRPSNWTLTSFWPLGRTPERLSPTPLNEISITSSADDCRTTRREDPTSSTQPAPHSRRIGEGSPLPTREGTPKGSSPQDLDDISIIASIPNDATTPRQRVPTSSAQIRHPQKDPTINKTILVLGIFKIACACAVIRSKYNQLRT